MAALVRDGLKSPRVKSFVQRFNASGTAAPQVLDSYARSVLQYTNEDIETLKTPERMLDEISAFGSFTGDCDDASIFVATVLYGLGVETRFVAIRVNPTDADFTHVFAEGKFPWMPPLSRFEFLARHAWVRFDPTVAPDTIHQFAETMVVNV
jgi:transglutaminase-like putative cysteine protease